VKTILVLDDVTIFRDLIVFVLKDQGYNVLEASNGREALAAAAVTKPDLVMVDMVMPEMNGLEFVRILKAQSEHKDTPVIILTALSQKEHVLQAAKMGIQDYILKSQFSLDDLLARIKTRLEVPRVRMAPAASVTAVSMKQGEASINGGSESAVAILAPPVKKPPSVVRCKSPVAVSTQTAQSFSDLKPIITREELIEIVNEGLELKPLAPMVRNVVAATTSSTCSAEDVAKALSQDQALSIRVLKLANGSMYSRGRPINNLRDAVGRLGIHEVRHVVTALGVVERYEGADKRYVDVRLFWEHSIASGLIASAIGRICHGHQVEDYFLWGMLHDVGRLILLEHVPDKYAEVCRVASELKRPLEAVESKLLLLDHCSILQKALQQWRFAPEFIVPVVNHHHAIENLKRLGPAHFIGAATVALANRIAKAMLLGNSGNTVLYPFEDLAKELKLEGHTIHDILDGIPSETYFLKISMLASTPQDQWPDYTQTIKKSLKRAINPMYISSDPKLDTFEIFFNQIKEPTADPPNLGVIYISDARMQGKYFAEFDQKERDAGLSSLPVLLICNKGQIDENASWCTSRPTMVVKAPARIDAIVETINALLES
jgi:HD-like signal output (HDOD) protein/DNA-binding NarL/FixJ family response regulator